MVTLGILALGGGFFRGVSVVTKEWAVLIEEDNSPLLLQVISALVISLGFCLIILAEWKSRSSGKSERFSQSSLVINEDNEPTSSKEASISSLYIPKVRSCSSDREVEEFLWESFKAIQEYFRVASQALMQSSPAVKLEIESFVDDSFTGRVYLKGQPMESFTIYQDTSSQGIVYIKEYNHPRVAVEYDGMAWVDDLGEELAFDATIKPARFLESWSGGSSGNAKDIAEYFWQDFISCVEAH